MINKTLIIYTVVLFIAFGANACSQENNSSKNKQMLTDKIQKIPCEFTKDNFNLIKNKVENAKIIMGDWAVAYVKSDNSLSFQYLDEEIFVVFLKGNDVVFIALGKIGFTVSEEKQKELFCSTIQLIKNQGSSHN